MAGSHTKDMNKRYINKWRNRTLGGAGRHLGFDMIHYTTGVHPGTAGYIGYGWVGKYYSIGKYKNIKYTNKNKYYYL